MNFEWAPCRVLFTHKEGAIAAGVPKEDCEKAHAAIRGKVFHYRPVVPGIDHVNINAFRIAGCDAEKFFIIKSDELIGFGDTICEHDLLAD